MICKLSKGAIAISPIRPPLAQRRGSFFSFDAPLPQTYLMGMARPRTNSPPPRRRNEVGRRARSTANASGSTPTWLLAPAAPIEPP
jgi:hypothetical protein